jgi:hypothetical protein
VLLNVGDAFVRDVSPSIPPWPKLIAASLRDRETAAQIATANGIAKQSGKEPSDHGASTERCRESEQLDHALRMKAIIRLSVGSDG